MTMSNFTVAYAERVYSALLSLYPYSFRVRFAPEMVQLFRDCCHDALEKGEAAVLVAFWLRAVRDLCASVLQERSRELVGPLNPDHPLIGIIDVVLIPSIVTTNLIALGPILTLLVRGGEALPAQQFAATSAFFSFTVAVLAIVASVIITKLRPTVRLCLKLSA